MRILLTIVVVLLVIWFICWLFGLGPYANGTAVVVEDDPIIVGRRGYYPGSTVVYEDPDPLDIATGVVIGAAAAEIVEDVVDYDNGGGYDSGDTSTSDC